MNQNFHQKKYFTDFSHSKEERGHILSTLMKDSLAPDRLLEWGAVLALENKEWKKAEKLFSSLLERRKKILDWLGLAKALFKQSRYDEAGECYLEAVNQIKEPSPLLLRLYKSLAEVYLLKEDFLMAEEYCNKASTLDPHCKTLLLHRAMMYLKEKNYESAEKYFQKFLIDYSTHSKAWLGLALSRKALGDRELALACLKRCLDFDPENQMASKLKEKWSPSLLKNLQRSTRSLSFIV